MAIAGSLEYSTKIDTKGFEKGVNSLKSVSSTASQAIKVALGAITTAITGIGAYAIKVGSDFEAGMSKVKAISGATGEEINKLTEKAKEMGQKTKFSATESAEAFQYMAMAGWKTEDMLNGIEGIMNLAAASGEDLASVSDIVTDALTAFGLQAKDSGHFADVLAKASSNSNTNVGLMGATFKYVAPIAGSMKYSVEDTAVAIGLMANAGIKGEQAGTALRSMLTRLVKPPKEAADALKKLNISAKNSDGTMKPLSQTLQELRGKFSKLSDSQKASYASSIAGTEAMSGMLAIVNASHEDFNKLTDSIKNSSGASKEMADTMNDNVEGAFTLLKSNLEGVGIKIYDKIKEPLKKIINTVSEYVSQIPELLNKIYNKYGTKIITLLKNVYNWVKNNQTVVKGLIKVVASLVAGYLAYKAVLVAINAIQTARNILKTVSAFVSLIPMVKSAKDAMLLLNMAFSANPVGLVVAGITALIATLVLFSNQQTENQKAAEEMAKEMAEQRKALEEYNKSIDDTTNANLAHINSVSILKDELKTLVDENGKVKEGYKSRVDFILNQLNEALGTEYKLNGNVVQSYRDLQSEIDNTINKKKAQIILQGEEEKYKNAIENQEQAIEELSAAQTSLNELLKEKNMTLDELERYYEGSNSKEAQRVHDTIEGYKEALGTVQKYTDNVKKYEDYYKLYTEERYDEIGKTITNATKNWSDSSLEEIRSGIAEQKVFLDNYKKIYDNTGNEIAFQQQEQARQNLQNLAHELAKRTETIGMLSREEIFAWHELAKSSTKIYSEELENIPEATRKNIEIATGYVADSSLPEGMAGLGSTGTTMFQKMLNLKKPTSEEIGNASDIINKDIMLPNALQILATKGIKEFESNYNIDEQVSDKLVDTSKILQSDTNVSNASKILAINTQEGFNRNVDGEKWGNDLSDNIAKGINSINSQKKVTTASNGIAGIIKSIIGHSVPKEGPLKDELTYMPDMIDNLVEGIEKNKYKVINVTSQLAKDMKNSFDLRKMNDEIYRKMQNAVSMETASINATASVKANNSMLNVIQAKFNIDGSVAIDGQKAGRILAPSVTKTIKAGGLA